MLPFIARVGAGLAGAYVIKHIKAGLDAARDEALGGTTPEEREDLYFEADKARIKEEVDVVMDAIKEKASKEK